MILLIDLSLELFGMKFMEISFFIQIIHENYPARHLPPAMRAAKSSLEESKIFIPRIEKEV